MWSNERSREVVKRFVGRNNLPGNVSVAAVVAKDEGPGNHQRNCGFS